MGAQKDTRILCIESVWNNCSGVSLQSGGAGKHSASHLRVRVETIHIEAEEGCERLRGTQRNWYFCRCLKNIAGCEFSALVVIDKQ